MILETLKSFHQRYERNTVFITQNALKTYKHAYLLPSTIFIGLLALFRDTHARYISIDGY